MSLTAIDVPGPRPRVSVVIPARDEAANLPHVLPRLPEWIHELILVDGGSTDGTVDVARGLWPETRVVTQRGRGKGDALRAGFAVATGDVIVMLDADGSMDPAEMAAFVDALVDGADMAKGSRFLDGGGTADMTYLRMAGNWGLTRLARLLFGGRDTDLCYGYVAFWCGALPVLALTADGFEIETELVLRAYLRGLRVTEVPSFESPRIHGVSNLRTFPDGWRVLKTMVRERLAKPHRAVALDGSVDRRQDRSTARDMELTIASRGLPFPRTLSNHHAYDESDSLTV